MKSGNEFNVEEFEEELKAYEDVKEGIDILISREKPSYGLKTYRKIHIDKEKLPSELNKLINFINTNRASIERQNPRKMNEFLEIFTRFLKTAKKKLDRKIWDLLKEDVEAESLEYIHSLLIRSIDGMIPFFEDNSFRDLRHIDKSEERELKECLDAYSLALDRLLLLLKEEKKLEESEKDALNEKLLELQNESKSEPKEVSSIERVGVSVV